MKASRLLGLALSTVVVLGVGTACEPDDPVDQSVPADVVVATVAAGDGAGWVLGQRATDSTMGVWRLTGDGRTTRVGELPTMYDPTATAFRDGLAIAGVSCPTAASCAQPSGALVTLDGSGAIRHRVSLGPLDPPTGDPRVRIVGATGSTVWVYGNDRLVEVDERGTVVQRAAGSGGLECVVDGHLVAVLDVDRPTAPPAADPPVLSAGPTAGPATRTVELTAWRDGGWRELPETRRRLNGFPQVDCAPAGVEATLGGQTLIARWAPNGSWTVPAGGGAPESVAAATDRFVQRIDGTVARRAVDGRFLATGVTLPAPGIAEVTGFAAAGSDGFTVACGRTGAVTACRAAATPESPPVARPATNPTTAGGRPPETGRAKVFHYNICNAARNACTETQAANAQNLVALLTSADAPSFISLNEVCFEDFSALANRLHADGAMVVSSRREFGCRGPNRAFGNVVIYPGGAFEDLKAAYLSNPTLDCATSTRECRTMLCVKAVTAAGPMAQCTAHLASGSDDDAVPIDLRYQQALDYAGLAMSYVEPDRPTIFAGDFNLELPALPGVWTALGDLVLGNTINAHTGDPRVRLDHIFVRPRGLPIPYPAYCPTNASDHCFTHADWDPRAETTG